MLKIQQSNGAARKLGDTVGGTADLCVKIDDKNDSNTVFWWVATLVSDGIGFGYAIVAAC